MNFAKQILHYAKIKNKKRGNVVFYFANPKNFVIFATALKNKNIYFNKIRKR